MHDHDRSSGPAHETSAAESADAGKAARTARLQRKGTGAAPTDAGEVVGGLGGSSGSALPDGTRQQFEGSLGADLSGVRLHTGGDSASAASSLNAKAFTTGQDIHFGAGQYQPDDPYGMHLLAHEVAHTVQQGAGGSATQGKLEVSQPDDPLEHEADRAADAMVTGAPAAVSAGSVAAARKVQREAAGAAGGAAVSADNPTGAPAPEAGAAGAAAGARPMLRMGSRGPAVEELQRTLASKGHSCGVDGAFGPQTAGAVKAFQAANGLAADGVVGPMTWGALGAEGAPASAPGNANAAPAGQAAAGGAPAGNAAAPASGNSAAPATQGPAGEGPAAAGPEPAAGGPEAAGPPASDNPIRAAIVAAARAKIGTVYSDMPGDVVDGEKTRQGWETLTEIFNVGFPEFPKHIIKFIKHGKNNGQTANPNGLVSWCGIFATYAVITGGGNAGTWQSGNRVSNMKKITSDPKPGDVGYFTKNQHHCIIASVNGDQIETIDGNSYDGDSGGNGAITSTMRSRGSFAGFFKQVDD